MKTKKMTIRNAKQQQSQKERAHSSKPSTRTQLSSKVAPSGGLSQIVVAGTKPRLG